MRDLILQRLFVGAQRLVLHLQALDPRLKNPNLADQRRNQPAQVRKRQAFERINPW